MTISAKVILASETPEGVVGYTLLLEYPARVHPELMTHREFSRNASSTRAIPVKRMHKDILHNPTTPIEWGLNQPGMQATGELTGWKRSLAENVWSAATRASVFFAKILDRLGLHKQIVNTITWPFMHFRVIVTTTNLDNFVALRDHKDALPEIRELARCIIAAANQASIQHLPDGSWHLPFIRGEEYADNDIETLIKCSVARCARVSYLNHDGSEPSIHKDLALYQRLVGSQPIHASPTEHQFKPDRIKLVDVREHGKRNFKTIRVWERPDLHGNLRGVIQYRKTIAGEHYHKYPDTVHP